MPSDVSSGPAAHSCPLVVDLDGTFTLTDTLWESLVRLVKRTPAALLQLPGWALDGRAQFKQRVFAESGWDAGPLPLNDEFVRFLQSQQQGRRIVLATAADQRIAQAVVERHGFFDDVLASDGAHNLKGEAKLEAIRERVGEHFCYAGDSHADVPIWKAADAAVLVGVSEGVRRALPDDVTIEAEIARPRAGWREWLRAMRVYQWLKNLLVFVPLLLGFSYAPQALLGALAAFAAFSLVASGTYLLNDLADLDHDRAHPRKRLRPLASGVIRIPHALVASALLLAGGLACGAAVGPRFFALLMVYLLLTTAYSVLLKRYMMADVVTLASLYTLRILAGAVAIDVPLSSWLLAFSVFIFLSLALIKRCAELVAMESEGRWGAAGRGYAVADLRVLWSLGPSTAIAAVVVFGLFISADETRERFAGPELLWLAGLLLVYWISRLWIKTSRGEMHDDPIVYALRDRNSRVTLAIMGVVVLAARWVPLP